MMTKSKGFTLIEVMVVIIILGVLATIALGAIPMGSCSVDPNIINVY